MASSDTPAAQPSVSLPPEVLAIAGVVRLLCDVRLAVLALGFASLLADAAAVGPALVIGLLAAPFSYVPARSWERRGALISRSGILLAADMAVTVIVVFALRGSQFMPIYGAATVALLGVTVGTRLAAYMAMPVALAHLGSLDGDPDLHWLAAGIAVAGIVAMAWAGGALGAALRGQAMTARDLREAQTQQAAVLERVRIARDLHDTVAGDLAGATMLAQGLRRRLEHEGAGPEALQVAEQLEQACATAHLGTRTVLGELRRVGTTADRMLATVCRQWSERTGIPADATVDTGLATLPSCLTDDLRAMVLELLENVRRHAGATQVSLTASVSGDGIVVRVADDGCGFAAGAATTPAHEDEHSSPHFGLVGIRERLAQHGGRMQVHSPARGAAVELHVPTALVTAS